MKDSSVNRTAGSGGHKSSLDLSLSFRRLFTILTTVSLLIEETIAPPGPPSPDEILYVPLQPGQHFYADGVNSLSNSYPEYAYSYGGWFRGLTSALKLTDMDSPNTYQTKSTAITMARYNFKTGSSIKFSANTWTFVMWKKICTSTPETLNALNGSSGSFSKLELQSVFSTHFSTMPSTSDQDFAPVSFGDPYINRTSWFDVATPGYRQSLLFYASTLTISAFDSRLMQYMLGPYKGLKRYHTGSKFNIGITSVAVLNTSNVSLFTNNTAKYLQQALVDRYGTFVPPGTRIQYDNFFDPAINDWIAEPGNMRNFFVQFRFRLNDIGASTQDISLAMDAKQTMLMKLTSASTASDLTIGLRISRNLKKCMCIIQSDMTLLYQEDLSSSLFIIEPAVNGVVYSMKICMVLVQTVSETNLSSPLVNIVIEFASRSSANSLNRAYRIFPNVKVPFDIFGVVTPAIQHTETSTTTDILSLYLEVLAEGRGGLIYDALTSYPTTNQQYCHGKTLAVVDGTVQTYCQACTMDSIANSNGDMCIAAADVQGKNSICEVWNTIDKCQHCSTSAYWFSQTQRLCRNLSSQCPSSTTHEITSCYNSKNMIDESCSDAKYFDATTGCTLFSDPPVPAQSTCVCDILNCLTCLHTKCDVCKTGYYLLIEAHVVTCVLASAIPQNYGIDPENTKYIKPCMVGGCRLCTSNYKICTECEGTLKLDSQSRACVSCATENSRYWDSSAKKCYPCHATCSTCSGPTDTNCLSCPATSIPPKILRLADNRCTECNAGTEHYTNSSGVVYGLYNNGSNCGLCDVACLECTGPLQTNCVGCRSGYYVSPQDANACGDCLGPSKFLDNVTNPAAPKCLSCHGSCTTCNGTSEFSCTSCPYMINGLYLFADGSCKTCDKMANYYQSDGKCLPCHEYCNFCTGGATRFHCDTCAPAYFLYTDDGSCGTCTESGYYQDSIFKKCKLCDTSCLTCTGGTASDCTACKIGSVLSTLKTCVVCNISGPFFLLSDACKSCHATCGTCNGTSSTDCTRCLAGDYLHELNNSCSKCNTPAFYKDTTNPVVQRCRSCSAKCETCNGPLDTNCLTCLPSKYLTEDKQCTDCQASGMFLSSDSRCVKCDGSCVKCALLSTSCTECDTANGYILVNGSCVLQAVSFNLQCKPTPPISSDVVLSFLLVHDEAWSSNMTETVIQTMKISAFWSSNTPADFRLARSSSALRVDVKDGAFSKNSSRIAFLDIGWPETLIILDSAKAKIFQGGCSGQYERGSSVEEIKSAENQAAVVSGLTSTMSSTDSAVGMSLMGTLLAADPTGTFFRFTKILQIVNKLYFININYGKRLEAFLAKTSTKGKEALPVENIKSHRGKLSQYKVTLDFVAAMSDKVVLYLISWILKGVKRLLLDNCIMGKIGIYFCHYANRAHLIIFNLVFIDFIWLAPRTLMHARELSGLKINTAILVMCLIAADLCLILSHLLDDRIWRKALEHYTSLKEFCPIPETSSKTNSNNASLAKLNEPGSAPKQDDPNQDQTKQINYKKTYFEIDFNVHLMDMATNTLRVDESVFQSILCRMLSMAIWWRVILIQLTILSCQYANTLGLTVLLIIELSRLFATIYAYLKYKYLKNIICLLMEVLNCIAVGLFFLNALLISPKRFDELIMDFYQDAGIWIVIASCVAEYLLLLTYIGVATYDFFKNRKMMKRMNVTHNKYSLISVRYAEREVRADVDRTAHRVAQRAINDCPKRPDLLAQPVAVKSRSIIKNRLLTSVRSNRRGVEPLFSSLRFKPL